MSKFSVLYIYLLIFFPEQRVTEDLQLYSSNCNLNAYWQYCHLAAEVHKFIDMSELTYLQIGRKLRDSIKKRKFKVVLDSTS